LARLLLRLLADAVQFTALVFKPRQALAAENLILRRQIALFQERGIRPSVTSKDVGCALQPITATYGVRAGHTGSACAVLKATQSSEVGIDSMLALVCASNRYLVAFTMSTIGRRRAFDPILRTTGLPALAASLPLPFRVIPRRLLECE
jgi:hypothetical protein